jgi:repressor LexA
MVATRPEAMQKSFTAKQGQYLAFIYYYSKIHGAPPAEADFQRFFRVTPPAVHQMIMTLHARGFIDREPGKARTIRLRLTRDELPELD